MTEEHGFKPGDVVQLKSGGPRMTYEGLTAYTHEALCVWFNGSKMERQGFSHTAIRKCRIGVMRSPT